jgi:hypothetical protein
MLKLIILQGYICRPGSDSVQREKQVMLTCRSWRSSVVEQLICNQQVGGSNPFASSILPYGEVAEWTKAADCKSAGASLRRFESFPPHFLAIRLFSKKAGVAQLARASAFQAEGRGFEARLPLMCSQAHVAQEVEHILGKDEVGGSSPPVGSKAIVH